MGFKAGGPHNPFPAVTNLGRRRARCAIAQTTAGAVASDHDPTSVPLPKRKASFNFDLAYDVGCEPSAVTGTLSVKGGHSP